MVVSSVLKSRARRGRGDGGGGDGSKSYKVARKAIFYKKAKSKGGVLQQPLQKL